MGIVIPNWYHDSMAMTFRPDPQTEDALDNLVEMWRCSRQEALARAAIEAAARAGRRVRVLEAADAMWGEWEETLRRMSAQEH